MRYSQKEVIAFNGQIIMMTSQHQQQQRRASAADPNEREKDS